jgi:hypothetical protein
MAAVSPQHSFDGDLMSQPLATYEGNMLTCVEPDYRAFIPANSLRRMSRMLKMGLATSLKCLGNLGNTPPGAIVTGTGKGSLNDTERFLKEIREYEEKALNPTPFIQSTYNALNGLIALQQQCTQYNNTFVHRGFSFELALQDAMLLLQEGKPNVLAGAFEEITAEHFYIKSRIGHWKEEKISSETLYEHVSPGTISGEGSAFFLLSPENGVAEIAELKMLYKPSKEKLTGVLSALSAAHGAFDVVLTGYNADSNHSHYYDHVHGLLNNTPILPFKHLCGEYDTASAFAVWLAAQVIKHQQVPTAWFPMYTQETTQINEVKKIRQVLIYNNFFGEQHVFMLLKAS